MAQPVHFKATVQVVTRHDADVASYRLKAEKLLPSFLPGQFVHLTIDDYDPAGYWPESRVFSVANAVTDRRTIDITVSRQGRYTSRILSEVVPGSTVWGKGPYGEFSIDAVHGLQRAVLVAGGTGITPFCAFMDAALNEGKLPVAEAVLHYGARTPELLIYRALAEHCVTKVPGFTAYFYAEKVALGQDAVVQPGQLDINRVVAATHSPRGAMFYLSGPRPMIDAFRNRLITEHAIEQDQVVIDAWE